MFSFCSKQPQKLDEAIKIPKETIEILKNQVFGFDTFFVTSQDPYEVWAYLSYIFIFAYAQRSCCMKIGSFFSARVECCSKETCEGKLLKVMIKYRRDWKYVIFSVSLFKWFCDGFQFKSTSEVWTIFMHDYYYRINLEMNTSFSF